MKILKISILILTSTASVIGYSNTIYDALLKGGRVIDPLHKIDALLDVAIKDGKIAAVQKNIDAKTATKTISVNGLFVTPGLIDMHAHVFHGTEANPSLRNSYQAVDPDAFSFRTGVTTMVDAGSSGWRHFATFKSQTIDHSKTRVLAFVNIFGDGMRGEEIEQDMSDMSVDKTATVAANFPEVVVGIKLAHFAGESWEPALRAVDAAKRNNLPVMVDFGHHFPELSLEKLFHEILRPGDIFTHMYGDTKGRTPLVDEKGQLREFVRRARKRGILFDVGHGGGSFVFSQAVPATKQGFFPDSISTDLHAGSMNAAMKDMPNLMSKIMSLGATLPQVIAMATSRPAEIIRRPQYGQIGVGAVADIAVFKVRKEPVGFYDIAGTTQRGAQMLECEMTFMNGKVMWDRNARSFGLEFR